jgi:hypothetical protein
MASPPNRYRVPRAEVKEERAETTPKPAVKMEMMVGQEAAEMAVDHPDLEEGQVSKKSFNIQ